MDQNLHTPEVYDFRQYDRLWQRVAPGLEPYPAEQTDQPAASESSGQAAPAMTPAQDRQASLLPGAEENPCCMGTAAMEMLQVLTGFAEEELEDQRQLQALSRRAPSWARQRLREMAAESGARAKRLLAVHYLITGECYRPSIVCQRIAGTPWCAALRERYHVAACTGMNYARAADGTTDVCLGRLLEEMSSGAYRQADSLLAMLERSMRTETCAPPR